MTPPQLRIGPAGWSYKDWEGTVYPPHGSKFDPLAYLASFFDTIEINSPFYRIPPPTHAKSWVRRVGSNPASKFTTKLFRGFTHEEAPPAPADVKAFRTYLDPMMEAGRLGAVLLQYPWSFKSSEASLEKLERLFRAFDGYPLALEVRHATFQNDDFFRFLDERGVAWVNVDQPLFHDSVKPAGTGGPIDHGKTALVRALTGVDTERLPEEKKRGITIDLGFASWFTDDYQIGFIDVPGHERFVKNMLAGIGGIDSALLVVAADESIKPQTREHFAICRLLDIKTGVIAITKRDLVEDDILDLVRMEIEEMVAGSFLAVKPIVPVSSVTGAGLDDLRRAILASVAEVDDRDSTTRVFRLPIDRVFTMKGFGSVITGTTYAGRVNIDTDIEVLPGRDRSRARSIQVHGEAREYASAGERTSVNLPDIDLDQLHRGQQLVTPNTLRQSQVITARLDLLADAKPLKEQTRIRFHHLSAELLGSIRFVDQTAELKPGLSAYIQVRLE